MYINSVENYSDIAKKLRYLEWIFLVVHLLLDISDRDIILWSTLTFYGIFIISSFLNPFNLSRWYKQVYILLAILLIVCANFAGVSLDLLIYLYIAKSCFLLGNEKTLFFTIVMGMVWTASECVSEIKELEESFRFEPPFGFGFYSIEKIAIYSLGIYLAASLLVILLSSVVSAEHKSRKKADFFGRASRNFSKKLRKTRIARDIHDYLGYILTSLDIQLAVAQKLRDRDPQKAFQAIDTAKILSTQCIEDVSHAVRTMRKSDFDLHRALNNLMEQMVSDRT